VEGGLLRFRHHRGVKKIRQLPRSLSRRRFCSYSSALSRG
jgi:hypothetical protein